MRLRANDRFVTMSERPKKTAPPRRSLRLLFIRGLLVIWLLEVSVLDGVGGGGVCDGCESVGGVGLVSFVSLGEGEPHHRERNDIVVGWSSSGGAFGGLERREIESMDAMLARRSPEVDFDRRLYQLCLSRSSQSRWNYLLVRFQRAMVFRSACIESFLSRKL